MSLCARPKSDSAVWEIRKQTFNCKQICDLLWIKNCDSLRFKVIFREMRDGQQLRITIIGLPCYPFARENYQTTTYIWLNLVGMYWHVSFTSRSVNLRLNLVYKKWKKSHSHWNNVKNNIHGVIWYSSEQYKCFSLHFVDFNDNPHIKPDSICKMKQIWDCFRSSIKEILWRSSQFPTVLDALSLVTQLSWEFLRLFLVGVAVK